MAHVDLDNILEEYPYSDSSDESDSSDYDSTSDSDSSNSHDDSEISIS